MWSLPLVVVVVFYLLITLSNAEYFEECSEVAEGSFVANPYDCRSYIYCSDEETSFVHNCPEDTYFNQETTKCVIDDDNICPGILEQEEIESEELADQPNETEVNNTTQTPTNQTPQEITTTTVPIKPVCDRHQDAYYPHYQSCEYYFKCIAGYLTILRCNFLYAWDYQREMCVPAEMADCYVRSI